MKKHIIALVSVFLLLCALTLSTGCVDFLKLFNANSSSETTPESSSLTTEATDLPTEPSEVSVTPPSPTSAEDMTTTTTTTTTTTAMTTTTTKPPKIETFYAYMADWSAGTAPYETEFAFDQVVWLTGMDAVVAYMIDTGCSQEEAEEDTQEYGYIRNVDPITVRWLVTTKDTQFYLPDEILSVDPIKVDYKTFLNTMIPAIEHNNLGLTFVEVTVSGSKIAEIAWVFVP